MPESKTVSIGALFEKCGIPLPITTIKETVGMYPYKTIPEENWAYFTTAAFQELAKRTKKEGKEVRKVAIVGIGSGVEAISALYIFGNTLNYLAITDIDSEILDGARENVNSFLEKSHQTIDVVPVIGSFCEPLKELGRKFDLIHANIPNLPASGDEDLSKGAEKGTFLHASLYEKYTPAEKYVHWALGAQCAYLASAKELICEGGMIITELGGRIPFSLVQELFLELNLELEEVVTGFKEQTEALIDFIGYHRLEKQYNVSFDFYLFKESKAILEQKGVANPSANLSGESIKNLLVPYRVSAGQATDLCHQGVAVGHTVHVLRGIKKNA